ncbi:hypothetical protein LINPERPRIM_LOCUS592, partial [Linum perenne]
MSNLLPVITRQVRCLSSIYQLPRDDHYAGSTTYYPDTPTCKVFEDPDSWNDITFSVIEEFHKFYHEYAYKADFSWRKMSTIMRICKKHDDGPCG